MKDTLASDHIDGWGTWHKVPGVVANRVAYSSIARHHWGSTSAVQTEDVTCEGARVAATVSTS
jgi:hypothetical protein